MCSKRKLIALVILNAVLVIQDAHFCAAQLPQYQLSRITEQEGLKTADIINIAKDLDGFMWLASQGHVQRFDGKHTLHFPFIETVEKVYADSSNRIWVITLRRAYLFIDPYRGFVLVPFNDADSSAIQSIFDRKNKRLCIAKSNGLYTYDAVKKVFQKQANEMPKLSKPVTAVYTGAGLEYWGTADSICRFDPGTGNQISIACSSRYYMAHLNNNTILFSTNHFDSWLATFADHNAKRLTIQANSKNPAANNFIVYSAAAIDTGNFLMATNKGLLQLNVAGNAIHAPVFYNSGQPLKNSEAVRYVFRDASGTLFIAHADGIFQMSSRVDGLQYFRNYSFGGTSLPHNDVRNFTEDENGNIWMATTNGIAKLNFQSGALQMFAPTDENNPVELPSYRQVLNDGPYIWIGSSGNGVWLLHKPSGRFIRPKLNRSDTGKLRPDNVFNTYIWKIVKLHNGQMFVAGGGRSFLIDPKSLQSRELNFFSSSRSSRSAAQDISARIWHGTNSGLFCMDSSFKMIFYIKDSFPDKRVAAFCEWQKGKMLIGTKGLYEATVSGNKLQSFERKKGVPVDRFIYCMQKDRQGYVWLGTDDGIFRYDPVHDSSVLFDQADFVQTQAFNSDAAFLSSKGLMFMGGKNGVNYFYPPNVQPKVSNLNPQISSLSINGNDSAWLQQKQPYKIAYQNRDISFTISAPEFRKPFSIRYRYKLNQEDTNWIDNDFSDKVRVNNLAPGKYAIQVSASSDGVHWFNTAGIIRLEVAKPWWQSVWFRLIYCCTVIAAFWLYRKYAQQKYAADEMKRAVNYFALSGNRRSNASDILWDIARNCISRLGFEDCVIYLVDEERNMLVQKAAYGEKSPRDFEIANPIELPVGKGITGYVAQTGKPLRINDTSADSRYIVDDDRRLSELAVPILHEQKVIGVIDSEHRRKHFFTAQHQQTLEQIAAICSSKIARSLAEESVQKAQVQLQELSNKMLESKFMNLRLQMNPHFLFNILTSIQYLVVSQQTAKATKYLNIFSSFLRSILQYAEETVVSLQDEIRILHMYVELETLSLDESFVYEIKLDEDIEQEEVVVPFMLLQPFVENAIHHGLVPFVGEKKFYIDIHDKDEQHLVCIIEDNGVGRKKAAEIKSKKMRAARYESKGVGIVIQRLELLGHRSGKTGSVAYEDLFDETGNPAGTRVTVIIPYYTKTDVYDEGNDSRG